MRSTRAYSNLLVLAGVLILGFAGMRAVRSVALPASPTPMGTATRTVMARVTISTATVPIPTATLVPPTPTPLQVAVLQPGTVTSPALGEATITGEAVATSTVGAATTEATSTEAVTNPTLATPDATKTATASPSATAVATATPTRSSTLIAAAIPEAPRIVIPKIDVNAGLVSVSWSVQETSEGFVAQWETAEPNVVGHHLGSARPGDEGNVVLSGHGSEQGVFSRLSELGPGDEIRIEMSDSEAFVYWVQDSALLPEVGALHQERLGNARYIGPTDDARLTLVTCWPAWAYTHRLVVIARMQAP